MVACLIAVCELFGETIRNMFGCVYYLLLNVIGVVECGWRCSIVWSSNELCVVLWTSERLDATSICFVLCFCMSEVISSFKS